MKSGHRKKRAIRAFTLVELLTVIVVIALLAAIMFAVIGKVRSGAGAAQCISNLRQLGVATGLYAQDNKNEIPYANYYMEVDTRAADKLAPYLQVKLPANSELVNNDVLPPPPFRCPASEYPATRSSKSHYGKNFYINSQKDYDSDTRRIGFRFTDIDAPSRYYYLADSAPSGTGLNSSWQVGNQATTEKSKLGVETRHSGRANILFLDFHVESLSFDQIGDFGYGTKPWSPRG